MSDETTDRESMNEQPLAESAPAESAPAESKPVSRRDALKVLGTVPMAAAVASLPYAIQQPVTPHVTPMQPAKPAAQPKTSAPQFFTAHEFATVALLADYIIPKDERSGSATDAKVPEYIDGVLADKETSLNQKTAMRGGLAWLDAECEKRFQKTFLRASDAQRRQVLDDIAYPQKATPEMSHGVSFFNRFRDAVASGFFSSAVGWQDLRYVGNVFNPHYDGCPPAALQKLGVSYDVMNTRVQPEKK